MGVAEVVVEEAVGAVDAVQVARRAHPPVGPAIALVVTGLHESRVPEGLVLTVQGRGEREAVEEPVGLQGRQRGEGGRHVHQRHRQVGGGAGIDTGAANQQRHLERLVGEDVLADEPVLTQGVAVVGGEDDDRVVQLADAAQRLDERLDGPVDRLEGTEAGAVLGRDDVRVGEPTVAEGAGLVEDVALVEGCRVEGRGNGVVEAALVPGRGGRLSA